MSWRIGDFAGAVGLGHRIEGAAARLVVGGDGRCGRRAGSPVPESVARSLTKLIEIKSIGPMGLNREVPLAR